MAYRTITNNQLGTVSQFVSPTGVSLIGSPSLLPIGGALGYDPTTPTSLYVGTGSAWSQLLGGSGGDVTLGPYGNTPNADGATLTGQVLTLQPASATFAGGISTSFQFFSGLKVFNSGIDITNMAAGMQARYNTPTFFNFYDSELGTDAAIQWTGNGGTNNFPGSLVLEKVGRFVFVRFGNTAAVTLAGGSAPITAPAGTIPSAFAPGVQRLVFINAVNGGAGGTNIIAYLTMNPDGSMQVYTSLTNGNFTGTAEIFYSDFVYSM